MALSECTAQIDAQGRELIPHGTLLFPAACYHDNLLSLPVPWHWHEELEALWVSEGSVLMAAGTEKFHLRQGQGFFVNAGVLHAVWADSEKTSQSSRLHSMVFHPRLIGGSPDSIYWQHYLRPLLQNPSLKYTLLDTQNPWQSKALSCLEAAWQSCVSEEAGYEFQVREFLSSMVLQIFLHASSEKKELSERALRNTERVKLMLNFIRKHYAEDLNVSRIAASAGISESEALRCFRSTIGEPPMRYLRRFRIQEAAGLLASTEQTAAEIGAFCGLPDASYFTKLFREQTGYTPAEYRKLHRKL